MERNWTPKYNMLKWSVQVVTSVTSVCCVEKTYIYLHTFFQSKALNKTSKPIFFNACEWGVDKPWEWMGEFANSWRTGPDHHDDWNSTARIIEINADKGKYAGILE